MAERMSAYEQTRAETIARNRAFLVNLGIDKPLIPTSPAPSSARKAPKRKAPAGDDSPRERRLTRQSVAPTPTRRPGGGDDDDYRPKEESGSESDDHHDYEEIPKPKPIKKAQAENIKKAQAESAPETDGSPCIVVEAAKTGRSKCRRCLELLAASALRVGMESWMVGRQVVVWQHPECFVRGLQVTSEATGRGKCKQTKTAFAAGERRISASAHITTAHLKLSVAPTLLRPVFAALPKSAQAALTTIEGYDTLLPDEQRTLEEAMVKVETDQTKQIPKRNVPGGAAAKEVSEKPKGAGTTRLKQPTQGKVAKAKGKVCWKFAGSTL